ncbi:BTAD domain-containing putative transcriptional regulator [Inquilinus sp. CAU 1745]|uniref:BTAD domain-containing putative transcriptional regulator n=1 Tax=Inquilinus sp. CAU 1745 TaxID=3140369 RepID=UPI00325A9ABF
MEKPVDSEGSEQIRATPSLHLRLLGPLEVRRDGAALTLPSSRKARALLAYLALSPRPTARSQLCELLWDVPNDPRGELRWCLSKIRGIVDQPGRRRVETDGDAVRLDLADCFVDAVEIARATTEGVGSLPTERLRSLLPLFGGDFLEGLELGRSPGFGGWLAAQRRRFRDCHAALLERLVVAAGQGGDVTEDEALTYLGDWITLAPFDPRIHGLLLAALARRGRIREGEEHLAAVARLFEAEGLDWAPIRETWRSARRKGAALSVSSTIAAESGQGDTAAASRRASIAVTPFIDGSIAREGGRGIADALAHDIITRLAKLRSLFVIAQGTMFALHERQIGAEEAGRTLNVDYFVGGSLRQEGGRMTVTVELAETRSGRVVWAEIFSRRLDDAFLLLEEIGNRIVASVASEIETIERNRAILLPPNGLDAWEALHRGLWHMYRFSKQDNERARHFFEAALRLDPAFSRAHAGLSFTHFQNAFQGWARRGPEIDRAFESAGRSLMADDRDPAAHWAMGRALWLRGHHDQSVVELEQAIDLSPNFALGHYTLAFVHSQAGDAETAISSSDHSRSLSPFDPMLFGMLGSRAMALVRLGRMEEAADWGVKAASRPNAHVQIQAIAALSLALAGRLDEARACLAAIRGAHPAYRLSDFLTAMQFAPDGEALFREGARRIGLE